MKQLEIIIEGQHQQISLDNQQLALAVPYIEKMDRDMDQGWQLGRRFLEHPNTMQRCQVAANRILIALGQENSSTVKLMSAYILTRLPGVRRVLIDTAGEVENTCFYTSENRLIP